MEERKLEALCWTLDAVANLDVFGKGIIGPLYKAALAAQGGPITLKAARALVNRITPRRAVILATGFPERAWIARPIAETDGPPGAATLAKALHLALKALPVIAIDEPFVPLMKATCIGAGLVPIDLCHFDDLRREGGFRGVFVLGVPLQRAAAHAFWDDLLVRVEPAAMIAIERPGANPRGVYHQVGGHAIPDDAVADMDYAFTQAESREILTIGVGDGGNEIGMGLIAEEVRRIIPPARTCGCPCGGGSAAATSTDVLLTATVSNWGATALEGALALVTEEAAVLHDVDVDRRVLEACVAAGGIDGGVSYGTELAVDDVPWTGYRAIVELVNDVVSRALAQRS
jgi:hypothetical protein